MVEKIGIERELKLIFFEEEREVFRGWLHHHAVLKSVLQQKNFYYDTSDFLWNRNREMFRIRHEGDHLIVTIKKNARAVHGCFECEEREWEFFYPADEKGYLNFLVNRNLPVGGLEKLFCLGMITNRREVWIYKGFILELDESFFPSGKKDQELECETLELEIIREELVPIFESLKIPWREQGKSKYRRFLEDTGILPIPEPEGQAEKSHRSKHV